MVDLSSLPEKLKSVTNNQLNYLQFINPFKVCLYRSHFPGLLYCCCINHLLTTCLKKCFNKGTDPMKTILFNLGECVCSLKSNTSCYQLMCVRPHSKHRENPQIKPNLCWNGMCPVETIHLDRVFQCYACQSHWARTTCLWTEKRRERETKVVGTDKCVVMFMGLE